MIAIVLRIAAVKGSRRPTRHTCSKALQTIGFWRGVFSGQGITDLCKVLILTLRAVALKMRIYMAVWRDTVLKARDED